jgi:maltose-binding protein MalE
MEKSMIRSTVMLLAALSSGAVLAAAHTAAPATAGTSGTGGTPDPKLTARCNSEAKAQGIKRAERKAFLKTCMAGAANSTAAPQSVSGADKPALETAKP